MARGSRAASIQRAQHVYAFIVEWFNIEGKALGDLGITKPEITETLGYGGERLTGILSYLSLVGKIHTKDEGLHWFLGKDPSK